MTVSTVPPNWITSSILEIFVKFKLKGGLWRITPLPFSNNLIDFPFLLSKFTSKFLPFGRCSVTINIYMVYLNLIYLQNLKCQRLKGAEALGE